MTSHASRWISAPGEVFEFYMIYNKKPLALLEQVNKLKSRGLLIDDKPLAIRYLSNISYYRLRAYTYPFQDNINGIDVVSSMFKCQLILTSHFLTEIHHVRFILISYSPHCAV